MKKTARLLRVAAIVITLRDELEGNESFNEWIDAANAYLDGLLKNGGQKVQNEYEKLFVAVYKEIMTVCDVSGCVNELFKILQKDMRVLNVQHSIKEATNKVGISDFDVKLVKLLDSKLNII